VLPSVKIEVVEIIFENEAPRGHRTSENCRKKNKKKEVLYRPNREDIRKTRIV
jgi:hypothetical protein